MRNLAEDAGASGVARCVGAVSLTAGPAQTRGHTRERRGGERTATTKNTASGNAVNETVTSRGNRLARRLLRRSRAAADDLARPQPERGTTGRGQRRLLCVRQSDDEGQHGARVAGCAEAEHSRHAHDKPAACRRTAAAADGIGRARGIGCVNGFGGVGAVAASGASAAVVAGASSRAARRRRSSRPAPQAQAWQVCRRCRARRAAHRMRSIAAT